MCDSRRRTSQLAGIGDIMTLDRDTACSRRHRSRAAHHHAEAQVDSESRQPLGPGASLVPLVSGSESGPNLSYSQSSSGSSESSFSHDTTSTIRGRTPCPTPSLTTSRSQSPPSRHPAIQGLADPSFKSRSTRTRKSPQMPGYFCHDIVVTDVGPGECNTCCSHAVLCSVCAFNLKLCFTFVTFALLSSPGFFAFPSETHT
jgi:hypothetical protein